MVDEGNMESKNAITRVEDMPVYVRLYELAIRIARLTRDIPKDFTWLRIQSLRSSESVIANMAEGFYSQYSTEYLQCLYRCRREARETMTHLKYGSDVEALPLATVNALVEPYEAALEELAKLIASIERKVRMHGKSKPGAVREDTAQYEVASSIINHSSSLITH